MSTGVYRTDNASGKQLREDLLDEMTMISPVETPFFSNLGESTANQTLHEWLNDSISRSTQIDASAEGADASFSDLDSPARDNNYTQEIQKTFKVSWKQRLSENAGISDQFEYEKAKALKRWKLSAEYSLIYGSGISGASGAGWVMKGLLKSITTNFVSYASGTSLTEERFNDILELCYDDVEDSDFDVYVPIGLKRAISGFTGGLTKNIDADEARIIRKVDVYESDVFSIVRVYKHRDLTNANMTMIGIQPKYFKKAFLARPKYSPLDRTGANDKGMIWGALTLEFRQQKAGFVARNLVK